MDQIEANDTAATKIIEALADINTLEYITLFKNKAVFQQQEGSVIDSLARMLKN